MDLLDLLKSAGGGDSIGALAGAVGLDSKDTGKLIGALAPALLSGLRVKKAFWPSLSHHRGRIRRRRPGDCPVDRGHLC